MEEVYAFGGNPLDRVSERRSDAAWIAGLLDDPASRVVLLSALKPRVRAADGALPTIDWQTLGSWRAHIETGATCILLGLADGKARFALDATAASLPATAGTELGDLRALAGVMAGGDAAVLGEARAMLDWHARHRFCAACGTPTKVDSAGWCRRCPACKAQHFPRVDPVVIMLPVHGERALLGRNARRAGARFSCLAGFVEPGETLEEAVRREVHEEAGLTVARVTYVASQPWPFPSSLMCGFVAEATGSEVTMDRTELAAAQWFSRAEVLDMVRRSKDGDGAADSLAPPIAIGHQIARRWASGEY
ncbi:MAG: NAD(+) diphosphatase [Proteobacteria bacterium]|nr:NAD(+) diphosphatase [Pseudomonadota bacterium]